MTTIDTTSLESLKGLQEQMVARLSHFRRRVRTRLVLAGAAIFATEMAGTALLTFALDHSLRLGVAARMGLLVAAIAALAYEFWRRVVEPMRLRLGLVALAGALGKTGQTGAKELAAQVASVLELPRLLEMRDPPSPAMVQRAVRRCHDSLASVDFEATFDPKRLGQSRAILLAALVIPLMLISVYPHQAGLWARRLFLASSEPWPQNTYLEVEDVHNGRISVPRGEPYVLRVHACDKDHPPERVSLTISSAGKTTVLMKVFAKNDFRHDFAVVDQPLQLQIEGDDDDLGPITLVPVDRPRIAGLELISQHPRQATPEKHNFGGSDADLNFLVKTKLSLAVVSNVPLKELRIKSTASQSSAATQQSNTAQPSAANLRKIDPTRYVIEWTHEVPARFELELVAAESGLVSLPVPVSIGLKVDQVPRVTMAYTGVHPRITPNAKIPLNIDNRDDFGIVSVDLAIKNETPDPNDPAKLTPSDSMMMLYPEGATTRAATTGPATTRPGALETEIPLSRVIDVGAMKLPAGSLVSLTAEATDDCYTGQQTGKSRTVTFRLVPPEELFREILQRQQAERMKFRKQIEEAEKLRDSIRTVADLRGAADLARRHRSFQRETLRIATVLTESLTEIKLNGLGSPESHLLMEQSVLAPLKTLQDELISPQTPALDTLFPPEGAADPASIKAAADREEQIAIRMKVILKQMAQWDSFVDVLNQLDEIIKLETQVKDLSEKQKKKDDQGIFDK